ncbi:ATP-grasp domain-containing protein [Xylanibacillus composti]|uniref:Phosphoribosylglycinamide formyltransferase 2 n=1 Tax=Xylanibacillus composti TaxID=1572762 RepID=A0A8J4M0W3_9BACL|nr:peptide ligase PGM1-related protein [Xylanibacillus composti]MDT9726795.1 ATP-grasp domain-containing protein [Xylanibacillus composti]GIQ67222.1 phosphoribosylglycinamide formyltransferase 2 [Xylanibacillus composti]
MEKAQSFHLIRWIAENRDQGRIVWLFNIGAEKYWNPVQAGIIDRNEDRIVNRVEDMNLLLCRKQDVLIMRAYPDEDFLTQLQQWGMDIPHIEVPAGAAEDPYTPIAELVLQDNLLLDRLAAYAASAADTYFVPYAVTRIEEEIADRCGLIIPHARAKICAGINDKIANRLLAEELNLPVCKGKVCRSTDEIQLAFDELEQNPPYFEKVIIKDPFGASGKGLYIVDDAARLKPLLARLGRIARSRPDTQWLVEGWYKKKADINYQVYISPNGETEVFSIKKQVLRDTVYIGSQMPPDFEDSVTASIHEYGRQIGNKLYEQGYCGVAGIDSIITDEDVLVPIIEINGRFTLSTYISFIAARMGIAKMLTRYFRLQTEEPFGFLSLCEALRKENLLYDEGSKKGIIVYTSGTLPHAREESTGRCAGRLFALIAAPTWDEAERLQQQLEQFVERLTDKTLAV